MKKPTQKAGNRKRFRSLKRVVLSLLALLIVVVVIVWAYLPRIAEGVIRGMLADAGLEESELKVVKVGWNRALIEGVSASDSNWSVKAGKVDVTYDPFDLLEGKVGKVEIDGLDVEIDLTEGGAVKEVEEQSSPATKVSEGEPMSLHQQIFQTLNHVNSLSAGKVYVRIKKGEKVSEEKIPYLAIANKNDPNEPSIVRIEMQATSFTLDGILEVDPHQTEIAVGLSLSSPNNFISLIEMANGLDSPIMPEGFSVASADLNLISEFKSSGGVPFGLSGTLDDVRYDGGGNPVQFQCDSVNMQFEIDSSGAGSVEFRGSADELGLPIDPSADFELMLKKGTSPEWEVTVTWGDGKTKVVGMVDDLDLRGEYAAKAVSIDALGAQFSWFDGKFAFAGEFSNAGTSIPFDYQHTLVFEGGDVWVMDGDVGVGPVQHKKLLPMLSAVTGLFDDIKIEGTSQTKLVFTTGSHKPFQGALSTELRDATVDVSDGKLHASGVRGVWKLNMLPMSESGSDTEDPSHYTLDFFAQKVSIEGKDTFGYDWVHEAEKPVQITGEGKFGVEKSSLEGEIKGLNLYGEKGGNEMLLANTGIRYRMVGDVLHAQGMTSIGENKIPLSYWHEWKSSDDAWLLAGWLKIEDAQLEHPVENGVMFVGAMEGKTLSGKFGMKMDFSLGSEQAFDGVLVASLSDGTLTMEDDGPVLEGLAGDVRLSSLKEIKTDGFHRVTAKTVKAFDMEMSNLRFDYRIHPNGDVALQNTAMSALGGVVWVDPFVIPGGDGNYQFKLRMKRLDLAKLAKLFPSFNGSINGEIDGLLPIQYADGEFMPVRGGMYLTPQSRARLRYDAGNSFSAGMNPKTEEYKKMKMVEDSLRNLELKVLSIRMFDPRDGDKAIVLKLRGQAPSVPGSPPIHLNVNGFKPDDDTLDFFDLLLRHRDKLNFGL